MLSRSLPRGEQVEGSTFLFDSAVTGPAIDHFQQVPALFWGGIAAAIFTTEAARVQFAWQNPFEAGAYTRPLVSST